MQNRIEIKTLEDEDLDEMNDCEIEVDAGDIIDSKITKEFEKCENPIKELAEDSEDVSDFTFISNLVDFKILGRGAHPKHGKVEGNR